MSGFLRGELEGLFSCRSASLSEACAVKGANDRVDALTLLCREVLRESSVCYIDGELYGFDGRCYSPLLLGVVGSVLGDVLVDRGASPTDVRKMGEMPLSVIGEKSYAREPLLCFVNGVLDLRTWEFREGFDAGLRAVERMPFRYSPGAGCPLWERFLGEVLPDGDERKVLQAFFGMVYLDRTKLSVEKFALFVGSGANGKSVIFEVMKRVLGEDNVSTLDTSQLADERMLPYVKGRRLNFSPDLARQKDFGSALKALASGQDVTGRKIYGDAEKIKCPPLCFALNEMPAFHDVTDAFFRRMLLFSFDVKIPPEAQDRELVDKICRGDLPGIFNWMMEGCRMLEQNRGVFPPCAKMERNIALLRKSVVDASFPVKSFLEGRGFSLRPQYEGQPFTLVSQNEIDLGLRHAVSRHMITAELKRFGVQTHRSKELFYKVYQR